MTVYRVCILSLLATALAGASGCTISASPAAEKEAEDHYVTGQLLLEQGQLNEALAELARAVQFDPQLAVAHSAMGDIARQRGEYRQAVVSYRKACSADPYAFRPHYNLGVTYQLIAEDPNEGADYNEMVRKAIGVYLRAAQLEPADYDTNLNLSACYYQQGKYDLARKYCQAAIDANPDRAESYSNLGVIYDAMGQWDQAIAAYKEALEYDARQPDLLINLGSTYLKLGRVDQARRTFEQAARQDPTNSAPWEQIGSCHYRQNDRAAAIAAFGKALEIDPDSHLAHRGLGVVYMAGYLEDPSATALRDKALAAWRRSLELNANQPELSRLVRKYAASASVTTP